MSQGGSPDRHPDHPPRAHAVVWRPTGRAVPEDLAAALARQAIEWEESVGPFDAFARLLALPRGGSTGPGRVLLMVEPEVLTQTIEVRRVLERFDPTIGCWAYRPAQHPRLALLPSLTKPAEPQIVVKAQPAPGSQNRPKASNGSHLRLAGGLADPAAHQPPPTPATGEASEPLADQPESPRSTLTREELEMLLADDRDESR